MAKVLVVDDDNNISQLIKLYLEKEGYTVRTAPDGGKGLAVFKEFSPDLVILDIMLPVMDGWDVCREIRKLGNVPIIMLSAKGETFDKVLGLELGADDYIVKPFEPKELVARVKAILRRATCPKPAQDHIKIDNLVIDLSRYAVTLDGQELELPPKEIELLHYLAAHPNKVFTREQLLEQVWGFEYFGDTRTVDVHIKRLREKLHGTDKWSIKTVWGVGYKLEVAP